MPNWTNNSVNIHANFTEVRQYFVKDKIGYMRFNMHRLFPDRFPQSDATGDDHWNYNWAVDNTGSKWFPRRIQIENWSDETLLIYDSARAPNNLTLKRLHDLTGWIIVNDYEEPCMEFEGTFECINGHSTDDLRDYHPVCEYCGIKKPPEQYNRNEDDIICKECIQRKRESN